jgi:hypothetical protein
MSQLNPYAAPQVANPFAVGAEPKVVGFPGLWRQGNLLVLHKAAPLPDICLKSNLPASRRLKRNLQWHHPAVYLALLVNLIVYVVVAMIVQKRATLFIPLTEEWFARRKRRLLIAWGSFLLCLGMIVLGIVLAVNEQDWGLLLFLGGLIGGAVVGIAGLLSCRLIAPTRITDEYVWVKGVHSDYLDRLAIWPYNI